MLINAEHLSFAYGTHDIFKDAQFRVNDGERIGLVGRNGCGKSTLLHLLTGALEADSGSISKQSGITIGCLEQMADYDPETTLGALFLSVFADVREKERRLRALEPEIASATGEPLERLLKEYGNLQEFFADGEAYGYKSKIRAMTAGLSFSEEDLNKPFGVLSGGEKTRASLGMLLLKKPDLLLLDEPTNYLDIDSLTWLENTLKAYSGSFVLISHDRYFLDRVCTRIDEVERLQIESYSGNYSEYTKKREKKRMDQDAQYARAVRERKRQQDIIRRYRDINSKQSSRHARSREIALSKMQMPESSTHEKTAHFSFTPKLRSGDEVLTVENLSKAFDGQPLFENVGFHVERLDKIGIIGANGIGKSTLFNILRRRTPKDTGTIRYGRKVITGFYDQESQDLDAYAQATLIEAIRGSDVTMTDGEARTILAAFLFTGEDVTRTISDLSGGEKARIKLAKLILSEANFLLMDEPTNHIDMPTREILEDALSAYQGTLLFISHDRYFLNKVATKIYELTPDGIKESLGNYDDYIRREQEAAERSRLAESAPPAATKTRQKADYKKRKAEEARLRRAKKAVRDAEKAVEAVEQTLADLEAQMAAPDFYSDEAAAHDVFEAYEAAKAESERLTEAWETAELALEAMECE